MPSLARRQHPDFNVDIALFPANLFHSSWHRRFHLLHPWENEDTAGSPVHMTVMLVLKYSNYFSEPEGRMRQIGTVFTRLQILHRK